MAVNATVVQAAVADAGGASTSIAATFPGATTSGNLLIATHTGRGVGGNDGRSTLSGWTLSQNNQVASVSGTPTIATTWWKVADGTESTVTVSYTGGAQFGNSGLVIAEYDSTDLDLSSVQDSTKDESNASTDVTSQGSGTAGNSTTNALAIAILHVHTTSLWDAASGPSVSNSFAKQTTPSAASRAGSVHATRALTAVGSYNTTFSTTDTGSKAIGHILVFDTAVSATINVDDATPAPSQVVTVTKSAAFNGTPTVTVNGVSATVSNITSTTCDVTMPALSTFVASGTHQGTRWNTNITLALTDSDGTFNKTIQITPPALALCDDFNQQDAATYPAQPYAPAGSATGDDIYIYRTDGGTTGGSNAEAGTITLPLGTSQWAIRWYDVSAGAWQALWAETFTSAEFAFSNSTPDPRNYSRNLLKWSNGFGNAVYSKSAYVSVGFEAGAGPGGKDAWSVTGLAGTQLKYIYQQVAGSYASGTTFTTQAKAKAGTENLFALTLSASDGSGARFVVDLSDGSISTATSVTSNFTSASATVTADEDGYYLLTLTATSTAAFTYVRWGMYLELYGNSATTGKLYIADAQLELASSAGPYAETEQTSLSSNQTIARVVSDYNAVPYSNTPSDATWLKAGMTSVTDTLTLTDGRTLHKLKESAASTSHYIYQLAPALDPAGLVTFRMIFASAVRDIGVVIYGDTTSNYAYYKFYQDTGLLRSSQVAGTASLHSYEIEQIDTLTVDGAAGTPVWQFTVRCWPSTTSAAAIERIRIDNIEDGSSSNYSGNGSDGVYVGYMRAVQGYTISDSDVVTAGAAEMPLASAINAATVDGVSVAVGGTNYAGYSESLGSWTANNMQTAANTGDISPLGAPVFSMIPNTTSAQHYIRYTNSAIVPAASTEHTFFVELKSNGYDYGLLSLRKNDGVTYPSYSFNLATGAIGSAFSSPTAASIHATSDGWYVARLVVNTGAGSSKLWMGIYNEHDAGNVPFAGDGVSGMLVGRVWAVPGNVAYGDDVYIPTKSTPILGLNKIQAVVELPALSEYAPGGDAEGIRWAANTLELTDGTDTISDTLTLTPFVTAQDSFDQRDRSTYPTVNPWEPADAADGDDFFIRRTDGVESGSSDAAAGSITPQSGAWETMWYDLSAGAWGSARAYSFGSAANPLYNSGGEAGRGRALLRGY